MDALATADERALIHRCWERGDLSYLLHAGQLDLTQRFDASTGRRFVVCCSRRYGKSFWLSVLGVQKCVEKKNMQVRYAGPTQRMCRSIIEPHMRHILEDCPKKMKPKYLKQQGKWIFPNGSEFVMAGCDLGGVEKLRGTSMDLGLIDEAGFFTADLNYVYGDVLLPQLITTGGRILMASTPARTPSHPFTNYCAAAQADGNYEHRTIFDAPHITHDVAMEFIDEVGGIDSTTARREYLAEVVVDEDLAIVPEFFKNEDKIVVDSPLPSHYDTYVFADFGFNDLTAVGFYIFDFQRNKLVKTNELVFARANTGEIAPKIIEMERQLGWIGEKKPLMRIADAPLQQLADLDKDHGIAFGMARKDDADAALNGLRLACQNGTLEIHPRCVKTISHLRHGIWRPSRKDFERSGDFGHFDCIDETKYANRHVDRTRNPFPKHGPGVQATSHWFRADNGEGDQHTDAIKKMVGRGSGLWGR